MTTNTISINSISKSFMKLNGNILKVMDATAHSDTIDVYIYSVPGYNKNNISELDLCPITIRQEKVVNIDYEDNLYDLYSFEQWEGNKNNIIYKRGDSDLYWLFLDKEDIVASFETLEDIKEYLYQLSIMLLRQRLADLSDINTNIKQDKQA